MVIKKNITELISEIENKRKKINNIAILVPTFSEYDGIGRVAKLQAEELANSGYNVKIFALEGKIFNDKVEVEFIRIPKSIILNRVYRVLFPLDLRTVIWASRLKYFDLIIAHQYPMTYLAYLSKIMFDILYIYYNHGQAYRREFSINFAEKLYHRLAGFIENQTIKKADYFVSVSDFLRRELIERIGKDGVVIYNKVSIPGYKMTKYNYIRERYDIKENDPLILFVGRIVPHKGIHLLIQAFKHVKQKFPNAKLVIVGKPYYKEYFEMLKQISDDLVIFAGFVPDEELPYYYAACDVYATCSLWEGFNLPLAEAQAFGKPVVAFDVGAHREVVRNGFLVKEGDIEEFAGRIIKILEIRGFQPWK